MKLLTLASCCTLATLLPTGLIASERLENWLPEQCQYQGKFAQERTLQSLPAPLLSKGHIFFDCEAGLVWQTEAPIMDTIVYSDQGVNFRFDRSGEGTQITDLVHGNMSTMLQALMGGDSSYLQQGFTIRSETGHGSELELVPVKSAVKKYLQKILLQKSDAGMEIELINSEVTRTSISVSQITSFSLSGLEECRGAFSTNPHVCQALYFPNEFANTLQTSR